MTDPLSPLSQADRLPVPSVGFHAEGAALPITFEFGWICGQQREPSVGYEVGRQGGAVLMARDVERLRDFLCDSARTMGLPDWQPAIPEPSHGLEVRARVEGAEG